MIVSDLHPAAVAAGWTRSFRSEGEIYEMDHHLYPVADWEAAADAAGLALEWRLDAKFGEPEREIFVVSGREHAFAEASRVPAILSTCWTRP